MGDELPTRDGSQWSIDGFVAGPDHAMDWMTDFTVRPGLIEEYVTSTGAVLGSRDGWDQAAATDVRPYGGVWRGPLFVLTHRPGDAVPPRVAFLSCDVAEAVRIALEPAQGKNVEVHSPTIGMSAHRSATGSRP